jgi:hypothetical protein
LASHLDALIPTVEASLVMQSGSTALADVLYCFARQYQCLARSAEEAVLFKLEKRFGAFEIPLLFLAIWLHPKYKIVANIVLINGALSMVDAIGWIDTYVKRWCLAGEAQTSAATAVAEWAAGRDHWVHIAASFTGPPGKYWDLVRLDAGHARVGDVKVARLCLASAASKSFTVLPNAEDPERVFCELGRMITSSRTSLANTPSSRMLLIAADYRAKQREEDVCTAETIGAMSKTSKKFTNKAMALLGLQQISDWSVAIVSNVPVGGVVLCHHTDGSSSSGSGSGSGGGSDSAAPNGGVKDCNLDAQVSAGFEGSTNLEGATVVLCETRTRVPNLTSITLCI